MVSGGSGLGQVQGWCWGLERSDTLFSSIGNCVWCGIIGQGLDLACFLHVHVSQLKKGLSLRSRKQNRNCGQSMRHQLKYLQIQAMRWVRWGVTVLATCFCGVGWAQVATSLNFSREAGDLYF